MVRKTFSATVALMLLFLTLVFLPTSCGGTSDKEFGFNIDIKELRTDIEPGQYEVETLVSPAWGSGDGQVAHRPLPQPDAEGIITITNEAGYFSEPRTYTVDSDRRTYICDTYNRRIAVFDDQGAYVRSFPLPQNQTEISPVYMVVNGRGRIFLIYDPIGKSRAFCYDLEGNLISEWDYKNRPESWGEKEWFGGSYPVIGPDGYLYLTGAEDNHITLTKWGDDGTPLKSIKLDRQTTSTRLAVNGDGNLLTCDQRNLVVFDMEGRFIRSIKIDIWEPDLPSVLGLDREGSLYISTYNQSKDMNVFRYDSEGRLSARYFSDMKTGTSAINIGGEQYYEYPFFTDGYLYMFRVPVYFKGNLSLSYMKL